MKKILFIFLLFTLNPAFSNELDMNWCTKNGGIIEYDNEHNISHNCLAYDITKKPYIRKIYDFTIRPYFVSIIEKNEPLFLKITNKSEPCINPLLDKFNFKITNIELFRLI